MTVTIPPLRAGVYARISLDKAGEALGVERQVKRCSAKATALGWTVADEYVDNDLSASKDVRRPAYERLLADLLSGTINAVVVYDLDRLTRKPAELEGFIDLADEHGISLANVSGDVDLTTSSGRMMARIKGAVARQEAERIGERVAEQKRQRAEKGIPHKGRHRLYGYDDEWQRLEVEAAVIKEAFTRRAAGESTTSIAKDFTKRGIKTVSGRDWTSGVLGVTLTKHVYAGKVTYKGEVVADSIYDAIIDLDTFIAAQTNLANDSKGTNTRKYLLSGILVCRKCLTPMKGNPSSKRYRCSTTNGGCGRLSVEIKVANRWIAWAALGRALMEPAKKEPVRDFDAETEAIQENIRKHQDGYEAEIYTLKEASALIKAEKTKLTLLAKERAKSAPRQNRTTKTYVEYAKMNLSQKRAFISEHITDVVVHPAVSKGHQPFNPARFECHYPDGTKEFLESPDEHDPWEEDPDHEGR